MVLILTERKAETFPEHLAAMVVSPRAFITHAERYTKAADARKPPRLINLTHDVSYMGLGYYASLLAEARGHQVLPSVEAIVNLNRKSLWRLVSDEVKTALARQMQTMDVGEVNELEVFVAFGLTDDERFSRLARMVFNHFRIPLLVLKLNKSKPSKKKAAVAASSASASDAGWQLTDLEPASPRGLTASREEVFITGLLRWLKSEWKPPKPRTTPRWSLALLHDPAAKLPPSSPQAIKKFIKAGAKLGIEVEPIVKADLPRLAEYDALFIRENTNVNHHTFRFARTAEAEGMPVMDDSLSILRCTNKVYLAELLATNGLPAPQTVVLDRRRVMNAEKHLDYPMVLKVPDGSFSRGVVKVENRAALKETAQALLAKSDLILAQEFMPTAFDWRVGVLNRQPLFVSQYMMSRQHWQIVKHEADGRFTQGGFKTVDVDDAPPEVVALGLRAAALMGDGLYGVDIKQTPKGAVVIEVNDNPNLDAGVEDVVIKDQLYARVMAEFLRRIELKRG